MNTSKSFYIISRESGSYFLERHNYTL